MEAQPPAPILVLITLQRACARLIRFGVDRALQLHCPLHVLHVIVSDGDCERTIDAQVLDYLYALAGEAGADMTVLTADVAVTAVAEFARQRSVRQIVMGNGERAPGIAQTLAEMLPGVQVLIINEES